MITLQAGMILKITREMKQDIVNRNWATWQYKQWRVGNKVVISFVDNKRVIISNPRAASTTFSRDIIARAVQKWTN